MNGDIIRETFYAISIITILVLLYLLAVSRQLGRKCNYGIGNNRYKCILYLRLLHITSLIETLAYLLNSYGAPTSATGCAVCNYSIIIARQLQLLWTVLAWEVQLRTMTLALRGPRLAEWSGIFWIGLAQFMILLPIFGLVLTLSTWKSYWRLSSEPKCVYGSLDPSLNYVEDTRVALDVILNGVFFFQFLIQTRQASKIVNWLVADLKHISWTGENDMLERLTSDATDCKEKAKSASRRNFIIAANSALWAVLSWVIPNIEVSQTPFDIYLDRVAMVLRILTVNCSFYLIFSEWKQYICLFCYHHRRPQLGVWSSDSLPLTENKRGEHFLKRIGEDEEVEYFASPAVIYKNKGRSRRNKRTEPERCE